jgi:hypothetical protein
MIPEWAVTAATALAAALAKLLTARSDAEREEALMQAAEATKAGLDRLRWPNG